MPPILCAAQAVPEIPASMAHKQQAIHRLPIVAAKRSFTRASEQRFTKADIFSSGYAAENYSIRKADAARIVIANKFR
jgi:hypothetical protein